MADDDDNDDDDAHSCSTDSDFKCIWRRSPGLLVSFSSDTQLMVLVETEGQEMIY
jgi:hypothetical protein